MVLDPFLLNTQHYKVGMKGKVVQSRERSCAFTNTSGYLQLLSANFTYLQNKKKKLVKKVLVLVNS